jgi:hypothetical protein
MNFREQSQFDLYVVIWKWLMVLKIWFAMRYRRFFIVGTVASMGQNRLSFDFYFYVSPFLSVTARHLHAAALPLKDYFYGPLRGRRSASLPLASLAKGRRIKDSPPNPQSHINSTTTNAASKPTKKQPPTIKKSTTTNQHNLKDENGDEVQVYSQNKKVRYTSVCELF